MDSETTSPPETAKPTLET